MIQVDSSTETLNRPKFRYKTAHNLRLLSADDKSPEDLHKSQPTIPMIDDHDFFTNRTLRIFCVIFGTSGIIIIHDMELFYNDHLLCWTTVRLLLTHILFIS